MAVERGQFYYDEPISKYWPEFAAKGKGAATVRHALTHKTAVPQAPESLWRDPLDWEGICAEIAAMEPQWEPGRKSGYHGFTFGWILGEVLRRTDGRPIARFLQEEVCRPLGIADSMFLGIPDEVEPRVATLYDPPPPPPGAPAPPLPRNGFTFNQPNFRRASIPAGGGIMSARAIARFYAALANGGELDGARILSPERLKIATTLDTEELDAVMRFAARKALGFWLAGPGMTAGAAGPNAFGFQGFGGSVGFADPDRRFAFALTRNYLGRPATEEPIAAFVERAVEEALGIQAKESSQ
jgi:CubicO group peptidase (beta-lactamase class C family)